MSSDSRGRDAFFLLAGALIGGAAVYCLYTPEGKKMTRRVLDRGSELKDKVVTGAEQLATNLKDQAQSAASTAQDTASQVAQKITDTKETLTEAAREKAQKELGSLEQGIAKARAKLEANSSSEKA